MEEIEHAVLIDAFPRICQYLLMSPPSAWKMIADRYLVGDTDAAIIANGIDSKWPKRIALTVRRYVNATADAARRQFYSTADWICTCGISSKWIFCSQAWTRFILTGWQGAYSKIKIARIRPCANLLRQYIVPDDSLPLFYWQRGLSIYE